MKIFVRTLILLAAAGVVVVAMLAFGRSSMATSLIGFGPGHGGFERGERGNFEHGDFERGGFMPPEGGGFNRPEFGGMERGEFGHGDRRGASIFGVGEVIKNLVIMGVITAIVVLLSRVFMKPKPTRRTPPSDLPISG